MAAELPILVSSFLESKPETYAPFFLECVDSKQHLNAEKIPDGWVGKVNTLLNSKTDSWLGICLLGITVEQCDTETFRTNCSSWLRTVLQTIQAPGKSSVLQYCSKLLDDILRYAAEFSELSRELSNSVIPSIVSTLLSNKCSGEPAVLSILSSCVRYFPGPVVSSRNQIEKFLLPLISSPCDETMKAACHCYALLPRCSRSGSSDNKQVCAWEVQWNKVLCTIHKLLDAAYENVEPVASRPSQESFSESETLPLADELPQVEPDRTHTLITRCNTLLYCLSAMIREDYPKVAAVPVDATMNLLTRIMSVTNNSLKSAVVVESVLLRASLPLLHTNALDLLTSLVTRCGHFLLPFCDLLIKILVQELFWTKSQNPTFGQHRPYRKLRCSIYQCIEQWIQLTKSLPEEGGVVAKLMQHILDDIKPLVSQTKLLPTASGGNQQLSKKAKKRKIQDDVDQLLTGQQKFDVNANEMVTYRALKALCAILIAGGSEIPQDVFREIQVCTVKLVIQCQQSSFNSFPIPFSSAECRQALYHVLLCCLLTNSPNVPSPVNHAVKLFSLGHQDIDFKVSSFCQEALAVANSIIHPRVFPQVCSAPGPILLSTSEHPSSNGPLSEDLESPSESCSSNRDNHRQMTRSENVFSQQSILSGGSFESNNVNGIGYSQREQISVEHRDFEEGADEGNTVYKSLTNVENESMEGIEHETSEKQTEQSGASGRDTQKEISHSEVANTYSQAYELELIASRSKTMTAQLQNPEKCTSDRSQMSSSETLLREDDSSQHQDKINNYGKPLGLSDPKRRRVEGDNSNAASETQVEDNKCVSTPNKNQLTENTTESEAITIEDDDVTAQILATFVDSYPDPDEPQFG
ncbi:hypothetical protein ACROYT_G029546 [Oculina patagonica]